jgi:hypothetical protein
MPQDSTTFIGGAKVTPINELTPDILNNLGPLAGLVGTWTNFFSSGPFVSSGWNLISVPAPPPSPFSPSDGFTLEVIPYQETLSFQAAVINAGNRSSPASQTIYGLIYQQNISSLCTTDLCNNMGFGLGAGLHAETGMFLFLTDTQQIVRLATIPHGNSILAIGTASEVTSGFGNTTATPVVVPSFIPFGTPATSSFPTPQVGMKQYNTLQFPDPPPPHNLATQPAPLKTVIFDQTDPNSFLAGSLLLSTVNSATLISLSTQTDTGGVLNTPFLQNNVSSVNVSMDLWIENVTTNNITGPQLQYTQTINLSFTPIGGTTPVIFPHVTLNTLVPVGSGSTA